MFLLSKWHQMTLLFYSFNYTFIGTSNFPAEVETKVLCRVKFLRQCDGVFTELVLARCK